jgi:SAM-dependent methyltransferase
MSATYSVFAKYYDAIYAEKDYKAEVEALHRTIQMHKQSNGNTLLDAACGTGGHIQYLRRYYSATGMDISPEMLEVARGKFGDVEFHQGNIADFDLGRQFDVVTCLFGSISYLTTKELLFSALKCFSNHTVQGGLIIIEPIFTAETVRRTSIGISCVDESEYNLARVNSITREGDIVYLNFHYLLATPTGVEHIFDPSPMGVFSKDDFAESMRSANLRVVGEESGLSKEAIYVGVKQ